MMRTPATAMAASKATARWEGHSLCPSVDDALHARLADLLRRYDVNDYAAGVKVFAVKPR